MLFPVCVMLFPVRCYTCNAVLAHLHPEYERVVLAGDHPRDLLRTIPRMCCRRMFLGYVDLISDQKHHGNVDLVLDASGTILRRHARTARTVTCD